MLSEYSNEFSISSLRSGAGNLNLHVLSRTPGEEERALALGALMRRGRGGHETGGEQLRVRGADIGHLETEIVQARSVLRQPRAQRVLWRERLDQLELGVAKIEMGEADSPAVYDFGADHAETHAISPDFERLFGRGDNDGEVIEAEKAQRGNFPAGLAH